MAKKNNTINLDEESDFYPLPMTFAEKCAIGTFMLVTILTNYITLGVVSAFFTLSIVYLFGEKR
jgi:hypothetical protein